MRILTGLVFAVMLASPALADDLDLGGKTLKRWDFATSAEGWLPTHSLAPFEAKDGVLHLRAIGPDPYTLCANAKAFDIPASDRQYVVIRAKVNQTGNAEFFWASSPTGEDTGFAPGKEVGFQVIADGAFHTYLVLPIWKDHITRLRFDPPDVPGVEVWVDYIAIMELPESPAPARPVFTFEQNREGWAPRSDVSAFTVKDGSLQVAGLPDRAPSLVSPAFAIAAQEVRFIQLRLSATRLRSLVLRFATKDDPEFDWGRAVSVPVNADGKAHSYLLPTSDIAGWSGEITRLELSLVGARGEPRASFDTIALTPAPVGPAAIVLSDLRLSGAVLWKGEHQKAEFTVQNAGGAPLEGVKVTWSSPMVAHSPLEVAGDPLAPGEAWQGALDFVPTKAGPQRLSLRAVASGVPPVEQTIEALVSEPLSGGDWIRHKGAYVDRVGSALWLVNEKIGAVFAKNAFGYGPVSLRVLDQDGWRQIGVLPDLGEVVTSREGQAAPQPLYPTSAKVVVGDGRKAAIEFSTDAAPGVVRVTFVLRKGGDLIDMDTTFTPRAKADLLAFRLPKVLAGDGAFGTGLKHGLFGGLEYLAGGERSSSTLDIAPPDNLRFAPHPNRVTLPAMAVASPAGDLVGLIWDATQRWDGPSLRSGSPRDGRAGPPRAESRGGADIRPTAVFASPNFLDNQPNHLMTLFVPSVPEWVNENSLAASKPYPLTPGKSLRLQAAIALARNADVLRIVRLWYDRFGAPALPDAPRDFREDVAFSLRSYEQVLWVPGQGWRGLLQWAPERNPRVALHYVLGEMLLGRDAPIANARQVAQQRMAGQADVDLAVHLGGLLSALHQARASAYSIMASQDEKGGWYFQPDAQHRPLGRPGDTTVGTVAGNVAHLLSAGRLLDDQRLIQSGEKGLAFMDQFTVPRGAQTWEVPLHTPDVLASANAVEACLSGYLATGNKRYLERAVFWAKTGIPFFYAWQAPEKGLEAMNYGCIPVFGATWYTGSWFGRIVQWCGLAYAHSVWRLAPYDHSFDWKRLAQGITTSAMIQQCPEPKYLGCYPDSIGMLDGSVSWGALLSPQLILDNVFSFLGRPPEAAVEKAALAGRSLAVVSAHELSNVTAAGTSVSFRIKYPAGWTSEAAVIGVSDPTAVLVNGKPVPRTSDLEIAATGYTYDESVAAVVIKIQHGAEADTVRVEGVRPAPEPAPVTRWDFNSTLGGWEPLHDLAPLERVDGALRARITGPDPFMAVAGLAVKAADYRGVRIRMRSAIEGDIEVLFAAGGQPIRAGASKTFKAIADDKFHDYEVDLSSVPGWTGLVTELRIDPAGKIGDVAEFDIIELFS